MQVRIEQLLHGYRRGHERLAGSTKLPAQDADLVTRLSDLSGSLLSAPDFEPYLTVYPLPSVPLFAVARTWLDSEAQRAGCVLTHTLLIPVSAWEVIENPQDLEREFRHPKKQGTSADYSAPLSVSTGPGESASASEFRVTGASQEFVHLYFCEGKRPIAWFGEPNATGILWRLLRGLWPKLRARFSSCTLCLQPRTLEERPFDLMFAPADSYPRFSRIDASHFVNGQELAGTTNQAADKWCGHIAETIFAQLQPDRRLFLDLWHLLDDEPTSLRRLLLIDSLTKSGPSSPQAVVGAMDLVESLARGEGSALESKSHVAKEAVRAAVAANKPADGLESLKLIEERLNRPAFGSLAEPIGRAVTDGVYQLTVSSPESAIAAGERLGDAGDVSRTWFGRGLLHGIQELARERPDQLVAMHCSLGFVARVLAADMSLAPVLIALISRDGLTDAERRSLETWLENIREPQLRRMVRLALIPRLNPRDERMLNAVLQELRAEDVADTLDAFAANSGLNSSESCVELVCQQVAQAFPFPTRKWALGTDAWSEAVVLIIACTYHFSEEGLDKLLNDRSFAADRFAAVLATYILRASARRVPYWLKSASRSRPAIVGRMLAAKHARSQLIARALEVIASDMPDVPIAHYPDALPLLLDAIDRPYFVKLFDIAMCDLIRGYVRGTIPEREAFASNDHREVGRWIQHIGSWELKSLLVDDTRNNTLRWLRAWRWIANAPAPLYQRAPLVLDDLVDALTTSYDSDWTTRVTEEWRALLLRSKQSRMSMPARLRLAVQALQFAFRNRRLPLSAVVSESFPEVYLAVTTSSIMPPEAGTLFGYFDWDKGKQLRKELVDAYVYSDWPPGDLAITAHSLGLLSKIFKRVLRKSGGTQFCERIIADLVSRQEDKAGAVAAKIRQMLDAPDFYEAWD